MHKILHHKITLIVATAVLAVTLGVGIYAFIPSHPTLDTVVVARRDISEDVSTTGKIDAAEHVSLSFGRPGTVASIPVTVGEKVTQGQLLASLDISDLEASLHGAQADVAVQEANLSSLSKGLRPEQVAVTQESVATARLGLETTLQDSYLKAEDAVRNKMDGLFINGGSPNPQYNVWTDSLDAKSAVEQARVVAGESLDGIKAIAAGSAYDDPSISTALSDFSKIKSFIDLTIVQVNLITTTNSGLSQSQIDSYTLVTNAAAAELNGAISAFNASRQALNTTSAQLSLANASGTPDALDAQEAQVSKAEANVASIQSQIAHAVITAPWDGVVASVAPKVGEDVAAGMPEVDLISDGAFTMDVYVPESDIAKVSVNTPASVTIDAYGPSSVVPAHVSSVDLSETVANGIGSYKATIALDTATESATTTVRAGMSATALISGRHAQNVLAVPTSALVKKADGEYVLVKKAGGFVQTKVGTGIEGGGWTEAISGVSEGDQVAAFGIGE